MRWIALSIVGLLAVSGGGAAAVGLLTLDLSNWGEGVYYVKGRTLGQETNGKEGFQDAPTIVGGVAGDVLILP